MAIRPVRERDLDLGRICIAMQKDRLIQRRQREEIREAVRQYKGAHHNEEGTALEIPVNLISLYVGGMLRTLIGRNPRGMISTYLRQAKPIVSIMESWVNRQVTKIRLAQTLRRAAVNAMFCMGIVKVAICSPTGSAVSGWVVSPGDPYADSIDYDDFVFDSHARTAETWGYSGHRFRVPLDAAKQMYGSRAKHLVPTEDRFFNLEGDERLSTLARGYYSNQEEAEDYVDLWEIWLPHHRVIVTLVDQDISGANTMQAGVYGAKALHVQRWMGPATGPYHILTLGGIVPGDSIGKAPVQDFIALHLAVNNIARKLIDQCHRYKETVGVSGGATDDAGRLIQASDGEMFRCDRPQDLHVLQWGGPNQQIFAMLGAFQEAFNKLAGNLDIMFGLAPQSKTAHQDEMLNQNSSRTVSDMQDATVTFTASVLESLCWFWHHHPQKVMRTTHAIPGVPGMEIPRETTPQERAQIPWEMLDIKIDPYSLQHSTPQIRSAALKQLLTQILIPLGQLLQQQGIQLDMHELLKKLGRYDDMPDLDEIITLREPPMQQPSTGGGQGSTTAPETTRNYVRRSMGDQAPGAKQNQFETMMAEGSPNGTQNGQQ